MKSRKQITSLMKLRLERKRRILFLGLFLMMFALLISGFAYCSQMGYLSPLIAIENEDNESFYMMSSIFAVMGLFCLNSIRGT